MSETYFKIQIKVPLTIIDTVKDAFANTTEYEEMVDDPEITPPSKEEYMSDQLLCITRCRLYSYMYRDLKDQGNTNDEIDAIISAITDTILIEIM